MGAKIIHQSDKESVAEMFNSKEIECALEAVYRAFLHDPFSQNEQEVHMLIRRIRVEASHQRDKIVEDA